MWIARTATGLSEAARGLAATCPACDAAVIPKCGPIIAWHWAHVANDCDPWSEPESAWHLGWKRRGFESEVVMRRNGECHRADIRTSTGVVVELQSDFLDVAAICARENFYGRMVWLYRATWIERLHFGARGFWWKHGSKAMALGQRLIFWDVDGEIWRVSLGLVRDGRRVVGKIEHRINVAAFERWIAGDTPFVDFADAARIRESPPSPLTTAELQTRGDERFRQGWQ